MPGGLFNALCESYSSQYLTTVSIMPSGVVWDMMSADAASSMKIPKNAWSTATWPSSWVHDELRVDEARVGHAVELDRLLRLDDRDVGLDQVLGVDVRKRHRDRGALESGRVVLLTLKDGIEPGILDVAALLELLAKLLEEVEAVVGLEVKEDELGLEQAGIDCGHVSSSQLFMKSIGSYARGSAPLAKTLMTVVKSSTRQSYAAIVMSCQYTLASAFFALKSAMTF